MTDELQRKVDRAVKLIQAAGKVAKEHGQPLEICYSGGKDSDVILELARMSGADIRPIYKNTTIDPPGTIAHARARGVEVMQPKMSFRQVVAKKGMPNRWRRFCCEVLKEYKVLDYAVVGVRRDESRDGQVLARMLIDGIAENLKNGKIVDLGVLGRLYPAVNGKWDENPDDLQLADMKPKVNYKAGDDIAAAVKGASLSWTTEAETDENTVSDDEGGEGGTNQGGQQTGGEIEGG